MRMLRTVRPGLPEAFSIPILRCQGSHPVSSPLFPVRFIKYPSHDWATLWHLTNSSLPTLATVPKQLVATWPETGNARSDLQRLSDTWESYWDLSMLFRNKRNLKLSARLIVPPWLPKEHNATSNKTYHLIVFPTILGTRWCFKYVDLFKTKASFLGKMSGLL